LRRCLSQVTTNFSMAMQAGRTSVNANWLSSRMFSRDMYTSTWLCPRSELERGGFVLWTEPDFRISLRSIKVTFAKTPKPRSSLIDPRIHGSGR
jgi:hypothetical protein